MVNKHTDNPEGDTVIPDIPDLTAMMGYAGQLMEKVTAIRRDLHAHPELLYDVIRTSGIVAGLLEEWGITVQRNVGRHFGMGVVGTLQGQAGSGPVILLRADMDALPIQEQK